MKTALVLASLGIAVLEACTPAPSGADADSGGTCVAPLTGVGFTSLGDMPFAALCAQGHRVGRWGASCEGSIVVVVGDGADCSSVYLFDASTYALQATSKSCNVGATECLEGVPGFAYPVGCFDGGFDTHGVVDMCPAGDAGGSACGGCPSDAPFYCWVTDLPVDAGAGCPGWCATTPDQALATWDTCVIRGTCADPSPPSCPAGTYLCDWEDSTGTPCSWECLGTDASIAVGGAQRRCRSVPDAGAPDAGSGGD